MWASKSWYPLKAAATFAIVAFALANFLVTAGTFSLMVLTGAMAAKGEFSGAIVLGRILPLAWACGFSVISIVLALWQRGFLLIFALLLSLFSAWLSASYFHLVPGIYSEDRAGSDVVKRDPEGLPR